MIFCHKPYYNLNYTNPNKKNILKVYALNPKNYTKYTNYIMQFFIKKIQEKNQKQNFKTCKLQRFTHRKKIKFLKTIK